MFVVLVFISILCAPFQMAKHMSMVLEISGSDSESDLEIDAYRYNQTPTIPEETEEEIKEHLIMSIQDLKVPASSLST